MPLIRSKLPRADRDDFVVQFGVIGSADERQYVFKKDAAGDFVCDVKHRADAERLLKVVEGYELHPAKASEVCEPSKPAEPESSHPVGGSAGGEAVPAKFDLPHAGPVKKRAVK